MTAAVHAAAEMGLQISQSMNLNKIPRSSYEQILRACVVLNTNSEYPVQHDICLSLLPSYNAPRMRTKEFLKGIRTQRPKEREGR